MWWMAWLGCGLSSAITGTTIGTTVAIPGQEVSATFPAPADGRVELWLDYELTHGKTVRVLPGVSASSGGDWSVDGPIALEAADGTVLWSETVAWNGEDGPLAGGAGGAVKLNEKDETRGIYDVASGSIQLDFVAVPAGQPITLRTTLTVSEGVDVTTLEVRATEGGATSTLFQGWL